MKKRIKGEMPYENEPEIAGAITATCSICGYKEKYSLDGEEKSTLEQYSILGRQMGYIQELFPKIPAWIRSGAIDQFSGGFCICPKCRTA